MDFVYVGDSALSNRSLEQFQAWMTNKRILLACQLFEASARSSVLGVHHNRPDVARDVVRSKEARLRVKGEVQPLQAHERTGGSITVDNVGYGRYKGELPHLTCRQACQCGRQASERGCAVTTVYWCKYGF